MKLTEMQDLVLDTFPDVKEEYVKQSKGWGSPDTSEEDRVFLKQLEEREDRYPGSYVVLGDTLIRVFEDRWIKDKESHDGELRKFFQLAEQLLSDPNPLVTEVASVEILQSAAQFMPEIYQYMGPRARQGITELRPHFKFDMPDNLNE